MRNFILGTLIITLILSCSEEQLFGTFEKEKTEDINARILSFDNMEEAVNYLMVTKGMTKEAIEEKLANRGNSQNKRKGTSDQLDCGYCDIIDATEFCEYINTQPHYFYLVRLVSPENVNPKLDYVYAGFDSSLHDDDGSYIAGISKKVRVGECRGSIHIFDPTFSPLSNARGYNVSFWISNSVEGVYSGKWGTNYYFPNYFNNAAICTVTPPLEVIDFCQ